MRSLSNFSITQRMALGFSLILLISMAVIGLSILRLNQLADATQEMVRNPVQTERLVSDWARNLASGITRAAAVARSSAPELADFFAAENKESSRRSSELQKATEALMFTDKEKQLFQEIGVQRGLYLKGREAIFVLKKEGRQAEAIQMLEKEFLPSAAGYLAKMEALLANQREQVNVLAQQIQDTRSSSSLLWLLGGLSVALSALIAWLQ